MKMVKENLKVHFWNTLSMNSLGLLGYLLLGAENTESGLAESTGFLACRRQGTTSIHPRTEVVQVRVLYVNIFKAAAMLYRAADTTLVL